MNASQLAETVSGWPDVETVPHRFGGVEFKIGRRELGHLHGDRFADLPFPRRVRDELVRDGKAQPHHVLPDTGWVTAPLTDETKVETALELFRLSYDRAVAARMS